MYKEWKLVIEEKDIDPNKFFQSSKVLGNPENVDHGFPLRLIGQGFQGAVYRVTEDKCVKLYHNETHAKHEKKVLLSCQHLPFIPKVYETSSNYIIMEYLMGPDLNSFLKKQRSMPDYMTRHLLKMLKTMKVQGFKQIDAPLRHTILTVNGLKLIDHVFSFTREQDRPLEMFKDLYLLNFLDPFLEQVKALDKRIYLEWTKTPIPLHDLVNKPIYTGPHIEDKLQNSKKTPQQIVNEKLLRE